MAVDSKKQGELIALLNEGKKPDVCEILKVEWSDAQTNYYAINAYSEIPPFSNVSLQPIEPKLLGKEFHAFELAGDLRTENINFTFSNIDGDIAEKFETYGSGVQCELYYYWANVDLLYSVWWGRLKKPDNLDYEMLPVVATNGFYDRESYLPKRIPGGGHCQFIWGGKFDNLTDLATNGCPYNKHLGGAIGNASITNCSRVDETECTRVIGDSDYFGGFDTDVESVLSDPDGWLARNKTDDSLLKKHIPVVFGQRKYRKIPQLFFRREVNLSDAERGFVAAVFLVGERVKAIRNIKATSPQSRAIQAIHSSYQLGLEKQGRTGYALTVPNFSHTAHIFARDGWVNAATVTASQFEIEADITGNDNVKVYTDVSTSSRAYSTNRAWILLELYTNKLFGKGYSHDIFDIQSFIDLAAFQELYVKFTDADGTEYKHTRTQFHEILQGIPAQDQITQICKAGRMSIPFQYEGKYHVRHIDATTAEISGAETFSDTGDNPSIAIIDGKSSLKVFVEDDRDLPNECVLTFNDVENDDLPRPITVDDQDQKARAGKAVGDNTFLVKPKRVNGLGIAKLNEAVKAAYAVLWFGELNEGGIYNNLKVTFQTSVARVQGKKKYDAIKIDSSIVNGKTDPDGNEFDGFQILKMQKASSNNVTVTAQAVNLTKLAELEATATGSDTPIDPPPPPDNPCNPQINSVAYANGLIDVELTPC